MVGGTASINNIYICRGNLPVRWVADTLSFHRLHLCIPIAGSNLVIYTCLSGSWTIVNIYINGRISVSILQVLMKHDLVNICHKIILCLTQPDPCNMAWVNVILRGTVYSIPQGLLADQLTDTPQAASEYTVVKIINRVFPAHQYTTISDLEVTTPPAFHNSFSIVNVSN